MAHTKTMTMITNCNHSQISSTKATIPRCRGAGDDAISPFDLVTTVELCAECPSSSRKSNVNASSALLRFMVSTIASKALASRSGTGVDGRLLSRLSDFSTGISVPLNRPSFQWAARIRIVWDFRRCFSAGVVGWESSWFERLRR